LVKKQRKKASERERESERERDEEKMEEQPVRCAFPPYLL